MRGSDATPGAGRRRVQKAYKANMPDYIDRARAYIIAALFPSDGMFLSQISWKIKFNLPPCANVMP